MSVSSGLRWIAATSARTHAPLRYGYGTPLWSRRAAAEEGSTAYEEVDVLYVSIKCSGIYWLLFDVELVVYVVCVCASLHSIAGIPVFEVIFEKSEEQPFTSLLLHA